MVKMVKFIIGVAFIIFTAFPALAANDVFNCERKSFSTINFNNSVDIDNVYPKELWIVIASDKSWAASYYGVHRNRSSRVKKNDIIRTKNGVTIDGNRLRTTGKIFIMIHNQGYKSPIPATYQCGEGKKTSWEPKD